jgi:two-component system chemotaxis sensor kinase CheA
MHLVRNCVDHGVEAPDERRHLGKSERGRVRLAARSEESHIVIVVEDDGAGIDAQKMRAAAVKKGLLDAEAARSLSDQEAIELIFLPGFSTSTVVSGVSGRGVGMDVVRTNTERLNGSVSVQTAVGQGTRFELKLPLTLAIFPALMVEITGSAYAIPLITVVEALHVRAKDIQTIRGREAIVTRGQVLPILRLDEFFRHNGHEATASRYVVEVRWGGTTVGLAVHRLLGRQEVVIKPLGRLIGEVPGISGGTIMGDGRVALIMDIPSLVKTAKRERQTA